MPGGYYIPKVSFDLFPVDAPLRKQTRFVWVDVLAASGNQVFNIFFDEATAQLLQDACLQLEVTVMGIRNDGSEGIASRKIATFKKDGAADPVQVGITTTVSEHKDNVAASVTLSATGGGFISVAFNTGGIEVYRWTIFATISQTIL